MRFERTPDLSGELEHFQHDTFIVRWKERNFNADAYVTFALNPDGSIERMKMAPISTETDFSYDFRDLNFPGSRQNAQWILRLGSALHAVAALALGAVQRLVGRVQQIVQRGLRAAGAGHAEAGGHRRRGRRPASIGSSAIALRSRSASAHGLRAVRRHHHEFLAAVACQDLAVAQLVAPVATRISTWSPASWP
jgi:hypothetical protein